MTVLYAVVLGPLDGIRAGKICRKAETIIVTHVQEEKRWYPGRETEI